MTTTKLLKPPPLSSRVKAASSNSSLLIQTSLLRGFNSCNLIEDILPFSDWFFEALPLRLPFWGWFIEITPLIWLSHWDCHVKAVILSLPYWGWLNGTTLLRLLYVRLPCLDCLREGFKKKNNGIFHPPTPLSGKNPKNVLYVMKRILYDMGHLTVAKWLL